MAHAKPSDLKDISSLLGEIRRLKVLKEKSMGCFYFKSKGILHFHVQNERRFAHVYDGSHWQEVDLPNGPSIAQQKKYFKTIKSLLSISEDETR